MDISVIGAGVVGCATAVGFTIRGHNVHLVECNPNRISAIREGVWKSVEPNLGRHMKSLIEQGQLELSERFDIRCHPEIIFICVGTPTSPDGHTDSSYMLEVIKDVVDNYSGTRMPLIAVRSTTPPGTISNILVPYFKKLQKGTNAEPMHIASNPEFLREGSALSDFLNPKRIVIGVDNDEDSQTLRRIYTDFNALIVEVPISTAEMIKSSSNAFLATKISFINEIGILCKHLGIDTYEVAKGLGYDTRIGSQYLEAGLGFGGSCIPKDLRALIHLYEESGIASSLLSSVQEVNKNQIQILENMIVERYGPLKKKQIAILGLSFKPGTDTVIESPVLSLIDILLNQEAIIMVHDPMAMENARDILGSRVKYSSTLHEAVQEADLVIITTGWNEYGNSEIFKGKHVIDTRRVIKERKIPEGKYEGFLW